MKLPYQRGKSLKGSVGIGCIYSPKKSRKNAKVSHQFYNSLNSLPKHHLLNSHQRNRLNQSNQNIKQTYQNYRKIRNQHKGYITSQDQDRSDFSDFEADEQCDNNKKMLKTQPQHYYGEFSPFRIDSGKFRQQKHAKYFQTGDKFYPDRQIALINARVQYQKTQDLFLDDSRQVFKQKQVMQIKEIERRLKNVKQLEKSLRKQELHRPYKSSQKSYPILHPTIQIQNRQRSQLSKQIQDINYLCQDVQHQYGHLMQKRPQSNYNQQKLQFWGNNRNRQIQEKQKDFRKEATINSQKLSQKKQPIDKNKKTYKQRQLSEQDRKSQEYHPYYTQPLQSIKKNKQQFMNGHKGGVCFEIDSRMFAYIPKSDSKHKAHNQTISRDNLQSRFMSKKLLNSKQQILRRRNNAKLYDKWVRKNVLGFK